MRTLSTSFLRFMNRPVKIIALKELRGFRLEGTMIGPYEEKHEYEEKLWVAEQLVDEGYVSIKPGQLLEPNSLSNIHWTEIIQPSKQLSSLPENFYPKLRKYLSELKDKSQENPRESPRYEKSKELATDVVERRLRRVTMMASGPSISNNVLRLLTDEERFLYQCIRTIIDQWRSTVLPTEERGAQP